MRKAQLETVDWDTHMAAAELTLMVGAFGTTKNDHPTEDEIILEATKFAEACGDITPAHAARMRALVAPARGQADRNKAKAARRKRRARK